MPSRRRLFAVLIPWLVPVAMLLIGRALPALAGDAVVGPAPCDEAKFDTALATVQGSGGGTLTFNCGPGAVITFTTVKTITTDVTIDGAGQVTLSGGETTVLFLVQNTGHAVLQNLVLEDGLNQNAPGPDDGGAIRNLGHLEVISSTLRNNRTGNLAEGGAIYSLGPVTITNSLFEDNRAGSGGALFVTGPDAPTLVSGTVFQNNVATGTVTGLGGAVLGSGGVPIRIIGGEIYSNAARLGGGIYTTSPLTMSSGVVDGNRAGHGGGVVVTGTTAVAHLSDTVIRYNTATDVLGNGGGLYAYDAPVTIAGGAIYSNGARYGGGLANRHGVVALSGGMLYSNSAQFGGGIMFDTDAGLGILGSLDQMEVFSNTAQVGGGIYQEYGTTSVYRTTFSGNTVSNNGAGLTVNVGRTNIYSSTFHGNVAAAGGGLSVYPTAQASLQNVTLSGNTATSAGGGASATGRLDLRNVTFSGNSATQGGGLNAGVGSTVNLTNTIIANSLSGGNCSGAITLSKYSLSSDNTCALAGAGDENGVDPMLSDLGNFGGPTLVHMLIEGSPAIDGVSGSDAPPFDQRGVARPQGAGFDIGAVERLLTDTHLLPKLFMPFLKR